VGTEDEVREHEEKCYKNFNNKGCTTCKHCKTDGLKSAKCDCGIEIPEGQQFLHCEKHETGKPEVVGFMNTIMGMFGGL
jgi:hypothetical protein